MSAAMGPASPEEAPKPTVSAVLQVIAALATLGLAIALVIPLVRLRLGLTPEPLPAVHATLLAPLGEEGQLVPQQGSAEAQLLLIESTPDGADVEVDGSPEGQTPASTQLHCPKGSQARVIVRAPGYHPWQTQVPCAPGTIARLSPRLKRQ
jgi:hypothetical protein